MARVPHAFIFLLLTVAIISIVAVSGLMSDKASANLTINPSAPMSMSPTPTPSFKPIVIVSKQPIVLPSSAPLITPKPSPTLAPPIGMIPLTLSISQNPVQLGGQITLSVTGNPGQMVAPFVNGVCVNDGFVLDSTGHYNDKDDLPDDMAITQPGTYEVYMYDSHTSAKSNTVALVVNPLATAQASVSGPAAGTTVTATPGADQSSGAQATFTADPLNNSAVNGTTITPTASTASNSTGVQSNVARASPAFPADAAAVVLIATGVVLIAMERSRKE